MRKTLLALAFATVVVAALWREANATYIPSMLQNVQCGTIVIAAPALSGTATLGTAVDTTRSFVTPLGITGTDSAGSIPNSGTLTLTNGTTVTSKIEQNGTPVGTYTVGYCVVQMPSQLFRSLQQGSVTVAVGATSATATVNSVNTAKAWLYETGQTLDCNSGGFSIDRQGMRLTLTNNTTITAQRNTADASWNCSVSFVLLEGR